MFINYDQWSDDFFPSSRLPKREVKRLVLNGDLPGMVIGQHVFICYESWQKMKPKTKHEPDSGPVERDVISRSLDKLMICE